MQEETVKSIEINNFKSIKKLKLNLRRINLIIGEPNTGKSNILDAIAIIQQIATTKHTRGAISLQNVARIDDDKHYLLFHRLNTREDISLKIGFSSDEAEIRLSYSSPTYVYTYVDEEKEKISLLQMFKLYRFRKLTDIYHIDERSYLLPPDGSNLLGVLLTHPEFHDYTQSLLERYGYRMIIDVHSNRVELFSYSDLESKRIISPFKIPLHLVSDTLLRTILYFAAIYTNRGSLIAFEEPESHVFPFYVRSLAESIALRKDSQYIITTHNPFFLIPLLERADREEVAVLITSVKEHETVVEEVTGSELDEIMDFGYELFNNLDKLLRRVGRGREVITG